MKTNNKHTLTITQLQTEPSYIINNISITDNYLFYIHNNNIQPRIISFSLSSHKQIPNNIYEQQDIFSLLSFKTTKSVYICLGLSNVFKIYSFPECKLIYQFQANNNNETNTICFNALTYYIKSIKNRSTASIFVGDSQGSIVLVYGEELYWRNKEICIQSPPIGISSLCVEEFNLVICVGFVNGVIEFMKLNDTNVKAINSYNNDVVVISMKTMCVDHIKHVIITGDVIGCIKVYDVVSTTQPNNEVNVNCVFNICSHLRLVTMVNVLDNKILSCGEDGVVVVWEFQLNNNELVVNYYDDIRIHNNILVGVGVSSLNNKVYTIGYDYKLLYEIIFNK